MRAVDAGEVPALLGDKVKISLGVFRCEPGNLDLLIHHRELRLQFCFVHLFLAVRSGDVLYAGVGGSVADGMLSLSQTFGAAVPSGDMDIGTRSTGGSGFGTTTRTRTIGAGTVM